MTPNQTVLARLQTIGALEQARRGPQPSPTQALMIALEEAIVDARHRRDSLAADGGAGTHEYLALNEQIARWEIARSRNR